MLVGFRALQGVGAAMLQAMGPAIVTNTFGAAERGKALGLNSVSVSIGLSLGPALGGILTEFGSWRWIFFVNVPVGVFAIVWAWRVLNNERRDVRQKFDPRGRHPGFGGPFRPTARTDSGRELGLVQPGRDRALRRQRASDVQPLSGPSFIRAIPMLELRLFRIRPVHAQAMSAC